MVTLEDGVILRRRLETTLSFPKDACLVLSSKVESNVQITNDNVKAHGAKAG